MYILTTPQTYPYSVSQLMRDNPQTSFPKNPSDEVLAQWNVFPVKPTAYPQVDHTKNVTEGTPVQQGGEWVQVWDVTDATAEEIAQRTDDQATDVRRQRNRKLADCDWTQLPDAPVDTQAWAAYRQELRNVPDQVGFPWSVTWPEQP
jgi:hypothetical protein